MVLLNFMVSMSSSSPQVLQSILCRAFELPPTDISISYRSPGPGGDVWLPMLSDWDLDTAILGSADHDLHLQVSLAKKGLMLSHRVLNFWFLGSCDGSGQPR